MRKLFALIAVGAILLAGVGCGGGIQAGTVYKKRHESEFTNIVMIPIQTGSICSGSPPVCTPIMTPFPFIWTDSEDWVLSIEAEVDGERKTNDLYVSEEEWNRIQVGDEVDYSDNKDADDDRNNSKKRKDPGNG